MAKKELKSTPYFWWVYPNVETQRQQWAFFWVSHKI